MWSEIAELWHYRSLLRMLVERDLKTRYRGSALGILWSFLQPLGMMLVMTLAFTRITRGGGDLGERPHIFILSGVLAWNMFTAAVVSGTGSVIANAAIVKKVYFPRVLLPFSSGISALINYLFSVPIFLLVGLISGHPLHETLLLVPVIALIQLVFCIGIAMLLGTLNVFYRDTAFIVELAMLALFFLTPVFYDAHTVSAVPINILGHAVDPVIWLRRLNPMASFVNIFQDLMYRGAITVGEFWFRTTITAIVVFLLGYLVFRRYSPRFAEEV